MDDCWSLFKKRAFEDGRREEDPKLVEIGKDIVNKCGGVPLAAKTLGSLMRFKSEEDEWLSIKESELWQSLPEDQDHIFPALRLSYIHLPQRLRRCFVFCSVFPKDYIMEKEELIHMWVANGLVQPKSERGELEVSHDIFKELLARSFFQDIEKDMFGDIMTCKIHDLMHDLAKTVSKDECCSIDSKEAIEKLHGRTKHLHVNFRSLFAPPTKIVCVAKRLRSLIFNQYLVEETVLAPYIVRFEFLRVLFLSGGSIKKIPSCIGSLKHLRYLNFSSTSIESLPESIGNLLNLQILKSRRCGQLESLPESIGNLGNLQILDLSYCSQLWHLPKELKKMRSLKHLNNEGTELTHMPTGIGHLRNLQTLSVFVVGENEGCLIKELGELDRIKGTLFIKGLSNVACARDAIDANLRRKQNINSLGLSWQQLDGEENIDEEVIEGLQPHSNLKGLSIKCNRGLRFPHWLRASSLPNLVELKLLKCRNYEKLSSLGQLPSLKSLHIEGLHGVKYIGNEFYGNRERGGFPSLEILCLDDMRNLEVISEIEGREHFPRLHKLSIHRCSKLIRIPAFPFLSEVELTECVELTLLPEGLLKSCTHLLSLGLYYLEKLVSLGDDLDNLIALKSLKICGCTKLVSLPEGLKYLKSLEKLDISKCENLMSLPEGWLKGLTSLKDLSFYRCDNLSSLSGGFNTSCSYALQSLHIYGCPLTSLPEGMHGLTALKYLGVEDCRALTYLPESMHHLTALEILSLAECPALASLPEGIHHLTALTDLRIYECKQLSSLPDSIQDCTSLQVRRYEKLVREDLVKIGTCQ